MSDKQHRKTGYDTQPEPRIVVACLIVGVWMVAACASGGPMFSVGPSPREIAGEWIDVAKTTPTDTLVWLLKPDGADRTLQVHLDRDASGVLTRREEQRSYGVWYLSGTLPDTANRALCFKPRARSGPTCYHFRLDTVTTAPLRKRLTVLDYRGNHSRGPRRLVERDR